jgi:uncharacterized protein DUF4396
MQIDSLTKAAIQHTLHCLLGCSIGEVLGMAISTALKWSNFGNIALSVILAFFFGYLLTVRSLYSKNVKGKKAIKATIATDTTSITSMEAIDNVFILIVPGAINAGLDTSLFWLSLTASLIVAFILTVPVNRWFIARSSNNQHMHHH